MSSIRLSTSSFLRAEESAATKEMTQTIVC